MCTDFTYFANFLADMQTSCPILREIVLQSLYFAILMYLNLHFNLKFAREPVAFYAYLGSLSTSYSCHINSNILCYQ